jgi:hypothetical protein
VRILPCEVRIATCLRRQQPAQRLVPAHKSCQHSVYPAAAHSCALRLQQGEGTATGYTHHQGKSFAGQSSEQGDTCLQ